MSFAVPGVAVSPSGAAVAPLNSYALRLSRPRKLALIVLSATFALTLGFVAPAPAAQAGGGTEAQRIVATAKTHVGKPWVLGATGMRSFDCSGFIYRVFAQNGLLDRIGGSRKTARGYWRWFAQRGLASRKNPKVGDLIIWGRGTHIGIYVGNGQAISTLTSGVKRHGVFSVTTRFTTYLHVRLER